MRALAKTVSGLALTYAALYLTASAAHAQDPSRVIVLPFDGPHAAQVEGAIEQALTGQGFEVVARSELDRAVSATGRGRDSAEVAERVRAVAIVDGTIEATRRRARARLRVRDAITGSVLAEPRFDGRNPRLLARAIERGGGRFASAIDEARAAHDTGAPVAVTSVAASRGSSAVDDERPPHLSEDAGDEEGEEDGATDSGVSARGPYVLIVSAGGSVLNRELAYSDDIFGQLPGYSLPAAPWLHGAARWYPGAHFTSDVFAHIGVSAEFGSIVGVRSRQMGGASFPTDSWAMQLGLDVRIPLDVVELGVGFGFGMHSFTTGQNESGDTAPIPGVEYQYLRPAVRGRVDLGVGLYLDAAFGWRFLTGTGALGRWFPRSEGFGADLSTGLGWESDLGLGVRVGFDMQRYFFAFRPEPGDDLVAGGAADQFLMGTLDAVWRVR